MKKKLGIYVHIPFCKKKCNYCDFYSVKWNEELENKYIDSVINEIKSYKDTQNNEYNVDTIFFGGGTPTIVKPENLRRISEEIRDGYSIDKNAEITIEANPNTLTEENLKLYREIGINRLSIGIQSLNDTVLQDIGRIHNSEEALEAIDRAKNFGFKNINADVMFNIPGQTISDIDDTLSQIIKKDVKHISFYSLKLEKGTPMYVLEKNNKIIMPNEDLEREMYYSGRNIMKENNLFQYEISNFSLKNYECKHNLKYWNQQEYIGIGPSAHSFLNTVRYNNPSDLKLYCQWAETSSFERKIQEVLEEKELIFEYIMLQLRLTKGLSTEKFERKFSINFIETYSKQIEYLIENKLLEYSGEFIKLTETGMDISNFVIEKFM